MTDSPTLHAWVDESIHEASDALNEGLYLLAATLADPAECGPVRDSLRTLLVTKEPRLHWRSETRRRRLQIAETVASFPLTHTVVIGAPLDAKRQERARRICMERLYFELHQRGVSRVWVESRHVSLNRRDREMVDALRNAGAIDKGLRVEFALPKGEPMLWVPDAVAGAVGAARKGDDERPMAALGDALEEISIELT